MSSRDRHERRDAGEMTRREVVSALARWTVPTVVTLSLATRTAHAASCPPCTQKSGSVCRACTVSMILNCQCEPCLGPPYCPTLAAPLRPVPGAPLGRSAGPAPAGEQALDTWLRQREARLRSGGLPGFGVPADSAPGGPGRTPFGRPIPRPTYQGGLYERLRPLDERRRP